jgi:hypothetical protein
VHNDRVTRRSRTTTLAVALVAAAVSLSGCGGSGSSNPVTGGSSTSATTPASTPATPRPGSSSASSSPSSSTTRSVEGVKLTPQGTKLKVGDSATVSWQPNQKKTGVIRVKVTQLQQVPVSAFSDFRLTPAIRKSTPYFVRATIRNLGKSDLSGVPVPLYLLDARNTLLQTSTFQALFPACPSRPLPSTFTRGKTTSVCLVYFAPDHGKLVAISFRPTEDFDAITWTGPVVKRQKK